MMLFYLDINHLRRVSLLLLLLFHGSSTCGWHKGPWLNRPRRDVRESLLDYDEQSISDIVNSKFTADEQNVKNEANIKAALDRLREVLSNDGEEKKSVDPKVTKYFSEQSDFWLRSPFSERNKQTAVTGSPYRACSAIVSYEIPQPLRRNSSDQFALSHFVINIPDFQQTVENHKCTNVDQGCGVDYDATRYRLSRGTCKQIHRHVKVLVLPNTKQYFTINDFDVATYEVEDGCSCVESQ